MGGCEPRIDVIVNMQSGGGGGGSGWEEPRIEVILKMQIKEEVRGGGCM